jgi:hypothetical protein
VLVQRRNCLSLASVSGSGFCFKCQIRVLNNISSVLRCDECCGVDAVREFSLTVNTADGTREWTFVRRTQHWATFNIFIALNTFPCLKGWKKGWATSLSCSTLFPMVPGTRRDANMRLRWWGEGEAGSAKTPDKRHPAIFGPSLACSWTR